MKMIALTEDRRQQARSHADRPIRCHASIFGDAVFRDPILAPLKTQLTEAIVRQPAVDQMAGEPGAPFALRRHARPDRQDGHQDAQDHEYHEEQRLLTDGGGVSAAKRIEEIAAPVIQPVLQGHLQHGAAEYGRGQ